MKACDVCLSPNTSVVDSREEDGAYVRRRRKCNACQARWTTYEVTEERYKAMRSATSALEKLTHAQREIGSAIDALREAIDPASEMREVA